MGTHMGEGHGGDTWGDTWGGDRVDGVTWRSDPGGDMGGWYREMTQGVTWSDIGWVVQGG